MNKQELLDQIKNQWERETKQVWNDDRWNAMKKILLTTLEGKEYLQILLREEQQKEIEREKGKWEEVLRPTPGWIFVPIDPKWEEVFIPIIYVPSLLEFISDYTNRAFVMSVLEKMKKMLDI